MRPSQLDELSRLIDTCSGGKDGLHATAIPGVHCLRFSKINARMPTVYSPSLCVVAQGRKSVYLGAETYAYEPAQYLAVSVDLAVIGEVTEASREFPYLCLQIQLDAMELAELYLQDNLRCDRTAATERGIFLGDMDEQLSDAVVRLANLLETPHDIAMLAPIIKREIYYRLLRGPNGNAIVQLAQAGSQMQRIATAIQKLKADYDKPFAVESLASEVGMSPSSFHAHFKAVTAMSPLQYQKRIRLLEARRIMLAEKRDALSTAYQVGYESASQFSREYARLFGLPPGRDIQRLLAESGDRGIDHSPLYSVGLTAST